MANGTFVKQTPPNDIHPDSSFGQYIERKTQQL